jgi:hypothetical protein
MRWILRLVAGGLLAAVSFLPLPAAASWRGV